MGLREDWDILIEKVRSYAGMKPAALWRLFVLKLKLSLEEGEERTARAAALGAGVGCSPTFGVALLLVYPLARWLRLNVAVAMLSSLLVSNPWTSVLIWAAQAALGFWALGQPLPEGWTHLGAWELLETFLWVYIAGAAIFGVLVTLLVYGAVYFGLHWHRM